MNPVRNNSDRTSIADEMREEHRRRVLGEGSTDQGGGKRRAARALAGLKGTELADLAGVNQATISRMENFGRKTVGGHAGTIEAVLQALAKRRVEIVGDDTLRLTKRRR